MTQVLDITAAVVTQDVLSKAHAGEQEVRVDPGALVTPSAWDFLCYHRLRLIRGSAASATASSAERSYVAAAPATSGATAITEILPPGSDAGVLSRGRYDHPDKAFGCRSEEFGSGFVEPSCCSDCAIRQAREVQPAGGNCGCGGCNKAATPDDDSEALVQQLTDEIMRRLEAR